MKELIQLFNYNNTEVRSLQKDDGSVWFCLRDINNFLGVKNSNEVAARISPNHRSKACFKDRLNRNQQNYNIISLEGLYTVISQTKSTKLNDLLNILQLDKTKIFKTIYHEQNYLNIIIESITGLMDYKTQFSISNYKIDLYIPSLKLAIECDEKSHKPYSIQDKQRENNIKNLLKCEFLRFEPDSNNFNIGNVINQIFKKYLNNSIKGEIYEFTSSI